MADVDDLSPQSSAWVRRWLQERSGICILEDQDYLVPARLGQVARTVQMTVPEVVDRLRAGDPVIADAAMNALTTHETSWFRDVHAFEAIGDVHLPALIARNAHRKRLRVWSAAASSGQELYSVALMLAERFDVALRDWAVHLVGTDVATDMVRRAQTGRFSQLEVDRGLPARLLVKYFERTGVHWQLDPAVRRMASFHVHNLVTDPPPGQFDLILCRYVLIYFDEPTRARVVAALRDALAPGGVLLIGAGEIGGKAMGELRPEVHGRGVSYVHRDYDPAETEKR